MQAVILAAGFGSRLKPLTGGTAKPLLEVGGRPLILHQLEALADQGVGPVLVIVGHQADEVQKVIGDRAEILLNDRFATTNSLYSLWLGREWIKGPFVLLNCDLFFDPEVLDLVLEESGNVLAYDSTSSRGREQTKVAIRQRRVVDLGKDLPAGSARGESLGLLKFDADGARTMLEVVDHLVQDGQVSAWVIEATRAACSQTPIYGVNVAGHPWTEIDFPYDLDVARREVWGAIWRRRWRRQFYWKRSRWAALGTLASSLLLAGWFASTRLGPASMFWDTVPLEGGEVVRIERQGKSQRWWDVGTSIAATGVVTAPAMAEVRLIIPQPGADSLRYVVAISVDGKAVDWRAMTATPDTLVHLPGTTVGDRDRIELTLPPGPHRVGVSLVAGHGSRMLLRLRQAEDRED